MENPVGNLALHDLEISSDNPVVVRGGGKEAASNVVSVLRVTLTHYLSYPESK